MTTRIYEIEELTKQACQSCAGGKMVQVLKVTTYIGELGSSSTEDTQYFYCDTCGDMKKFLRRPTSKKKK